MMDINKNTEIMKKIKILALLFISLISFNACQDDDSLTYIAQAPEEFAFSNSFIELYALTPSTANNIGERFTWSTPDFDVQTNLNYDLQWSVSEGFENPQTIATTSQNEYVVTIGNLINYAEEAGLDDDPETLDIPNTGTLYFRVRAYPGINSTTEKFSPVQALAVELLESGDEVVPAFKNLFLVGNATAPDWNNNSNNPPITRHPDNENIYSYRAYFLGGGEGFKLLEVRGQWQPQWGAGPAANSVAVNDGTGSDPAAIAIPSTGYYDFLIDVENLTYSLSSFDASSAATFATIGIIGDSTPGGWDADTDMVQSTFDPHIWNITAVDLIDGELKMRADNDWAINWGSNTEISGFATQDGPNIPVSAGTYDIWFNDLDGGYILIPVE